jgi:single-stranded DNA-binding protein
MADDSEENHVVLVGKISRLGALRYTPSGMPIREMTFAVSQRLLDKISIGYFELQLSGSFAEEKTDALRVGATLKVSGSLWARTFNDRQGRRVSETKVLVDTLVPMEPKRKEK